MALQEPKGIDRYKLGPCIGDGYYAWVFEAIDVVTKRSVAVKKSKPLDVIVEEGNIDEESWIAGLTEDEAEILSKLDHPNIIKLLDSYVHEDTHHLVLELMETDLDGIIEDPTISLSPADCKAYIQMILEGLAYLHENSIEHGDLSIKNVLIGPDGQLKLADFGLALFGRNFLGPEHDIHRLKNIVNILLSMVTSDCQSEANVVTDIDGPLREIFPEASEDFVELYDHLFLQRKLTTQEALEHRYFTSAPPPTPAHLLPLPAHHLAYKRREAHL